MKTDLSFVICITFSLINQVGPKKAREIWFLSRFYNAAEADKMGLVNTVVPVSIHKRWKLLVATYITSFI